MLDRNSFPVARTRAAVNRVSIVIRNYNYANYLPDAIESALAQTYANVQTVIVDDGSTDDSREVIRRYARECHVVLQKNAGEGAAVNAGFSAADGGIVIFLDADDVLAPNAAAEVAALWGPEVARVHFPMWVMDDQGRVSGKLKPNYKIPLLDLAGYLEHYGCVPSGAQSCNAYAAWALRQVLPVDCAKWPRVIDVYLNALTTVQGEIRLIQSPLGGWRRHASNWTLRNSAHIASELTAVVAHTRQHDAIREFVGAEKWATLSPRLPCFHWMHRLFSLRLNPDHPFDHDCLHKVASQCLSSVASRPNTSLLRRTTLLAGIAAAVVLPAPVLRWFLQKAFRLAWVWQSAEGTRVGRKKHWRQAFAAVNSARDTDRSR